MSHRRPLTLVLLVVAALTTLGAATASAAVPDLVSEDRPRILGRRPLRPGHQLRLPPAGQPNQTGPSQLRTAPD